MTRTNKNIVKILAIAAILVLALSFVLVGCDKLKDAGKPEAEIGYKAVALIIGRGDAYNIVVVKTQAEYMTELLNELKASEKITYESTQRSYGTYVTSLNNIQPQGENEWVAVYHDIDDVTLRADLGEWPMPNANYGGHEYYSSSVGVDLLPILDGHVYYFTLGSY